MVIPRQYPHLSTGSKLRSRLRADNDEFSDEQSYAVQAFVQRMEGLAHQNRTSRECVERFLRFGPTPINSDLEGELSSIKGRVNVENAQQLEALPTVVSQLQETISNIEANQNGFNGKLDEAAKALTEQSRYLSDHEQKLAESGDQLSSLESELKELRESDSSSDREVEKLSGEVEAANDLLVEAVSRIDALTEQTDDLLKRIESNDEVQKKFRLQIEEELSALKSRLEKLKELPSGAPPETDASTNSQVFGQIFREQVKLSHRGGTDAAQEAAVAAIESPVDAVTSIATNLHACGINRTDARIFAEEVLASISASQCCFFVGQFATRVAHACSDALAFGSSIEVSIPIGLTEPGYFSEAISNFKPNSNSGVDCLVVEGINRSAFDAIGDDLVQVLVDQRIGSTAEDGGLIVFATIADGASSLPVARAYSSLGAIFYVDLLGWQMREIKARSAGLGLLTRDGWLKVVSLKKSGQSDDEEVDRLLDICGTKDDPLIRSTFIDSLKVLSAIKSDELEITPLQSLHFGWVVPSGLIEGIGAELVEQELDDGKVDSECTDLRLRKMARLFRGR